MFADSEDRIISWWDYAHLGDGALKEGFVREAAAELLILKGSGTSEINSTLDWRRTRLLQDQRVPEWTRAQPA